MSTFLVCPQFVTVFFFRCAWRGPLDIYYICMCTNTKVTAIHSVLEVVRCLWVLPRRAAELHTARPRCRSHSEQQCRASAHARCFIPRPGRAWIPPPRRRRSIVAAWPPHACPPPPRACSAKRKTLNGVEWQSPKRGWGPEGGPEQVSGHLERWAATGRCEPRHSDPAALQRRGVHRRGERVPEQRGLARGDPLGR